MYRFRLLTGTSAMALLVYAMPTQAQSSEASTQTSAQPTAGSEQMEEIVVTAQKRSESLQSTPIAISAFTTESLEQKQISGVQQLQFNMPSLVYAQVTGYSLLSMRGIGSDLTTTAGEPTVATFQDGVYTGQLFAQSVPSFDLERIEVLRGPQGTLYGRNSTGGAINYISKSPSYDLGANFATTFGNFERVVVEAGVTGPIIPDKIAARVSVKYEDRDGYRKNIVDGRRYDANHQFSVLGALLFEPTENLDFTIRADSTKQTSSPVNQFIAGLPVPSGVSPATPVGIFSLPGPVLATFPGPLFSDADLARIGNGTVADLFGLAQPGSTGDDPNRSTIIAQDFPAETVVHLRGVSGTLVWDLEPFTVKSITAYRYSRMRTTSDADGTGAAILNVDPISQTSKQFTQEINISGKALDNKLDWLLGGYYFDDRAVLKADLFLPSLGDIILASASFTDPAGPPVFNLSQPFIPNLLQLTADPVLGTTLNTGVIPTTAFLGFGVDQTSKSAALFGQATYSLTDKMRLTAGLRYTKDTKDVLRKLHSNFVPASALCEVSDSKSWDAFTGTAGIDYDVGPRTLAYAKVSRGYKAGGFNPAECSNSFNPETLWAYEGGIKSTFAAGQARVNLAGFYYEFDDIQFTVLSNNNASVRNASSAKLYGLELEYTILPHVLEGLMLDGSGSYIHSEYGNSGLLLDPLDLVALDIEGNQLIRAPKWKLNFGAQYTANIDGAGAFTLRGESSYTSTIHHDVFNGKAPFQSETVQPSYWVSNARLIWQPEDKRFDVQFFVENIGNKLYAHLRSAAATGAYLAGQFSAPRTYGLRVSMKLGSAAN